MKSVPWILGLAVGLVLTGRADAATVWHEFPPNSSPAVNLTDAMAGGADILGVRVKSGVIHFESGNTYSGGTEIQGGVCRFYQAPSHPLGSGPVSIQGGRLEAQNDQTVTNNVTIDGDFSFGCGNASYPDDDITFVQPVVLTGNRMLTAYDGDGSDVDLIFSAGIHDGGNGYSFALRRAADADQSGGISLDSGSTYTGSTVIHGAFLTLIGSLTSTPEVIVNRGGYFGMYYGSSASDIRLDNGIPVYLRGGTMGLSVYQGGSTQWAADETVGTVALDYGHSTIQVSATRPRGTLIITNLVREVGSTARFYRYAGDQVANGVYGYGRIKITGQTAGFMGSWALARRNEYMSAVQEDSGYDFAWYDTGTDRLSGVLPMTLSAEPRPAQVEGAGSTNHVRITTSQTTLTVGTSVNSLAIAGSYTSDLGGHSLDVVSGGLLAASGACVITNGTITSSGGELHLFRMGSSLNVYADIVGATDVSTAGGIRLHGNNSFSGDLYVNSGTLTLTAANSFNRTASVAPGAVLDIEYNNALAPTLGLKLQFDGEDYSQCNMDANSHVNWATTNGVFLARGDYTSANLPGFVSGTGTLTVRRTGTARGLVVIFK